MALSVNDLNNMHLDVLREVGNIGAGNAATALATLINKKVDMGVPTIQIRDYSDISEILGGEESVVAGIYFGVSGDIKGNIMFLLDIKSAKKLIGMLMGTDETNDELDDMERSALQEIGNILSGSYISSLSALTGLFVDLSVPSLCVDMAGAILSVPAIQFGHISDKVLLIETILKDGNDLVNANFFLIPDVDSFEILLKSLGVL